MKLLRIDSTNARQPSWQILKEWEDVLSKETGLLIYKDSRFIRYIKARLNGWGLSSLYKVLFVRKNLGLRFIMNAQDIKVCDVNKFTIPIVLDFWLKEEQLPSFYEAYKEAPLILLTNLEVYEFLKQHKCPIPIEHWALSYPDKYAISDKRLKKEYDFCFIGRPNPFFVGLLDKYCLSHPDFCYIGNNGNINHRQYIDNRGNVVAEDTGRESYLSMIKKTKISCYTTPGIDESKKETSGFNQVTPRLFEMLCNQCHVIGHYPCSYDTNWYELNSIIPNVNDYNDFEKWLDYFRIHDFDIQKGTFFMNKHYTSSRVKSLIEICDKHDIEIVSVGRNHNRGKIFNFIGLIKRSWFRLKLRKASPHGRAELMRGQFCFLGKNVELYTMSFGTEPYLISIHDNAVCASGVRFINHDISVHRVAYYLGMKRTELDKVGSIELFENSFVGAYSILMPNCSVGKNSIVAAGSIVTKQIPDGEVWGGIPAKFIMKTEDYARKMVEESKRFTWMPYSKKLSMKPEDLIRCQQEFFFGNKF